MQATVLIADDDAAIRQMLVTMFDEAGYETIVAPDGRTAVALTRINQPDVVLLDVSMPRLDGLAACRAIKSDPRTAHIPVLLLTAFAQVEAKVQGLDAGATDYITKPFDLPELLARLRSALAGKTRHDTLAAQALTDALTGLTNRRGLEQQLDQMLAHAERHEEPLSLLMMDADHFKAVNDSYGHETGDQVLVTLARRAQEMVRAQDVIGRFGGEEFLIILPEAGHDAAITAAERLRLHVIQQPISIAGAGDPIVVTVSVGVATLSPGVAITRTALVAAADRALYAAKRTGRNRSVHADGYQTAPLGLPDPPDAARTLLAVLQVGAPREAEHAMRVGELCWGIAAALRLLPAERARIGWAGLLHDIGRVPRGLTPSPLARDEHEYEQAALDVAMTVELLSRLPMLASMAELVASQRENWDGSGAPHGLRGDDIPLGARIIAVADAYDGLTHVPAEMRTLPVGSATATPGEQLLRQAGTRLDPAIVDIALRLRPH